VVLVDSSVWIGYFRGVKMPETDRLDGLLESEPLATGDRVLTEVPQGFSSDKDFDPFVKHLGLRWAMADE